MTHVPKGTRTHGDPCWHSEVSALPAISSPAPQNKEHRTWSGSTRHLFHQGSAFTFLLSTLPFSTFRFPRAGPAAFSSVLATPNTSGELLTTAEQIREAKAGMKGRPTTRESPLKSGEEQHRETEIRLSLQGCFAPLTEARTERSNRQVLSRAPAPKGLLPSISHGSGGNAGA